MADSNENTILIETYGIDGKPVQLSPEAMNVLTALVRQEKNVPASTVVAQVIPPLPKEPEEETFGQRRARMRAQAALAQSAKASEQNQQLTAAIAAMQNDVGPDDGQFYRWARYLHDLARGVPNARLLTTEEMQTGYVPKPVIGPSSYWSLDEYKEVDPQPGERFAMVVIDNSQVTVKECGSIEECARLSCDTLAYHLELRGLPILLTGNLETDVHSVKQVLYSLPENANLVHYYVSQGVRDIDSGDSLEKLLGERIRLEDVLSAMGSLNEPGEPPTEYIRGQAELIGRLLLDTLGWGDGTGENAALVAKHLKLTYT